MTISQTAAAESVGAQLSIDVRTMLRSAMAHVASAVSVVTTLDTAGPHGTTVSAFMSLSMDPPLVLVSLDRTSRLLGRMQPGSAIALNILGVQQHQLAAHFAGKSDDKFAGIRWNESHGAPVLEERHALSIGTVDSLVPAGDHVLVIVAVAYAEGGQGTPLTYWNRTFGTHHAI